MFMPNITDVQMSTGPSAIVFQILIFSQYEFQVISRISTCTCRSTLFLATSGDVWAKSQTFLRKASAFLALTISCSS